VCIFPLGNVSRAHIVPLEDIDCVCENGGRITIRVERDEEKDSDDYIDDADKVVDEQLKEMVSRLDRICSANVKKLKLDDLQYTLSTTQSLLATKATFKEAKNLIK
jgi:hypothetical protein